MNETTLLIIIAALFLFVMILMLIIVLLNIRKTNDLNYQVNRSINEIQTVMAKDLLEFNRSINTEFNNFSERVNSNLIQSNKSSNELFHDISEQMIRIDESQKNLNRLSDDVLSLNQLLNDKKSRGIFGETELYNLLENIYGNNSNLYQKQYLLPNHMIADAAVFIKDDLCLCIDSKFPLENYKRIYDEANLEKDKKEARKKFREDVRKHLNDIASKYILPSVTADLAYMFIPSEAIFAEIYSNYPELIDLSYQLKVFIVSPTTLMAYITAIKTIYLNYKKDEKAQEIQVLLQQLAIEFKRYEERNLELYKDFQKLANAFYQVNISSEKIIRRFEKINAVDIDPIANEN